MLLVAMYSFDCYIHFTMSLELGWKEKEREMNLAETSLLLLLFFTIIWHRMESRLRLESTEQCPRCTSWMNGSREKFDVTYAQVLNHYEQIIERSDRGGNSRRLPIDDVWDFGDPNDSSLKNYSPHIPLLLQRVCPELQPSILVASDNVKHSMDKERLFEKLVKQRPFLQRYALRFLALSFLFFFPWKAFLFFLTIYSSFFFVNIIFRK